MKCYIVDDMISEVRVLSRIITDKEICQIAGTSTDPAEAIDNILKLRPEIVLVDLLMPDVDGITLVRKVKRIAPDINFIMISQVSNDDMVAEAYMEGVELFIRKPINIIEVENVMRKLISHIEMENMLGGIRKAMEGGATDEVVETVIHKKNIDKKLKEVKTILGLFGVLGERGTKDILEVFDLLFHEKSEYNKDIIAKYALECNEDERIVKQRIRRTIKKALTNVANIGVEDYYSEVFQTYGHMAFDFEAIRTEMDVVKGTSMVGGKASIGKFFDGIIAMIEAE